MTALKSLLVASALLGVAAPTKFYANGTVSCTIQKHWCFFIAYYEIDKAFMHDRIDVFGVKCPERGEYDYEMEGKEYGDGLSNDEYELKIFINHNCTTYGNKKRIERLVQKEPVTKNSVSITFNKILDNKGYPAEEFVEDIKVNEDY